MAIDYEKERREAIAAGTEALISLRSAQSELREAGSWGIWDILGGGLLVTIAKQKRMKDARNSLDHARAKLRYFEKELQDLDRLDHINLDTGDFLGFADVFFDGLFADLAMQDRIGTARDKVSMAIRRVEEILAQLHRQA